jgi:hypothetical protein
MRPGHGKNMRGPIYQRRCERLAPMIGNVDAIVAKDFDRMRARRLAAHGMHAG